MTAKETALTELRHLIFRLTKVRDSRERDLVCTPYGGTYETVAGWVIVVEGSPARGTILIDGLFISAIPQVFFIDEGKSRRLGSEQARIVCTFAKLHLPNCGEDYPRLDDAAVVTIPPDAPANRSM